MIVIAQDCVHAVTCPQTSDDFRARRGIDSLLRNVVSGQCDQIRIQLIRDRDELRPLLTTANTSEGVAESSPMMSSFGNVMRNGLE